MTIEKWLKNLTYSPDATMIFSVDKGGDHNLVLQVRGWGALISGPFPGKESEAAKFQDSIGEFVVEAIKEKLKNDATNDNPDLNKIFLELIEAMEDQSATLNSFGSNIANICKRPLIKHAELIKKLKGTL